jgi:hypothetical protein
VKLTEELEDFALALGRMVLFTGKRQQQTSCKKNRQIQREGDDFIITAQRKNK